MSLGEPRSAPGPCAELGGISGSSGCTERGVRGKGRGGATALASQEPAGGGPAALRAQRQGGRHRPPAPALARAVGTSLLPAVKEAHGEDVLCIWGWRSEPDSGTPNPQSLSGRGPGGRQARPLPPQTGLLRAPRDQTGERRVDGEATRIPPAWPLLRDSTLQRRERDGLCGSENTTDPVTLILVIAVSADS